VELEIEHIGILRNEIAPRLKSGSRAGP